MNQPLQLLSSKEKDSDWYKANANYWIETCNLPLYNSKLDLDRLYRFVEGDIDASDYSFVLNPYSTDQEQLTKFPSRLRNFPIITPIVKSRLGEKGEHPDRIQVVCANADAPNVMQDGLNQQMLGFLAQDFINNLNDAGVNTGVKSQPVPPYQQAAQQYTNNYKDNRAEVGQEALDYLKYHLKLKDRYITAFYHYLVTGQVWTYKDVLANDVVFDVVHPLEAFPIGKSPSELGEDYEAFVRVRRLTVSQVLARFSKWLTKETLELLYTYAKNPTAGFEFLRSQVDQGQFANPLISSLTENQGYLYVYHAEWMGKRKIQILTYLDELGKVQEREVDETYKLDKSIGDLQIEEEWINQVHEVYRIDRDIFLTENEFKDGGRPTIVQRSELNNHATCKLNYNGRVSKFPSLVKDGTVFQILYNIFHYRFELTMAKHKEKLLVLPLGLIPDKPGWDMDKSMYYIDSTGVLWIDETKPNAALALQGIKVLDLGLAQYAEQMIKLLESIKQEWWDVSGMNRQRYGDVMATDGKGTNQDAVERSSLITAEVDREFRYFEESDYQGLLDTSKLAWINGKKGSYINSDLRQAFLETDGLTHMETEYGVHCVDNSKEAASLAQMKQLAQPMMQNGALSHVVAEVIEANNMSKVKECLKRGDEIIQSLKDQQQQAESASNENVENIKLQKEKMISDTKKYVANVHAQAVLGAAQIAAGAQTTGSDISGMPDINQLLAEMADDEKELQQNQNTNQDQLFKREQDKDKAAIDWAKLDQKDRADAIKLQIAQTGKNKVA